MPKALVPSGLLALSIDEGAATPAPTYTSTVWSTLLGCVMYWDGLRWTAGAGGRACASAGLRVAVLGASTESRANPMWSGAVANYQRVGGVVTCTVDYALAAFPMLPGTEIRFACGGDVRPEGRFAITSCTLNGTTSMTLVFSDPRSDIAAGTLAGAFSVHALNGYTVSTSWPAHFSACTGGRAEMEIIASGGTNLTEWGDDRVDQIVARGYFHTIVIGTGVTGNTINAFGASADAAYTYLEALIGRIRDRCRPRLILVETPSASRTISPTTSVFTAAMLLTRRMWSDLPHRFHNVRVVACGEVMIQNYGAYNAEPSEDVAKAWPELVALADDGVHHAYPWSGIRGEALAEAWLKYAAPFASPEMGVLPDTNLVNTVNDAAGVKNKNYALGLWGNVASTQVTISGSGCSGVAPAGASMQFVSGRNGSTAVSALSTNPRGGAKWTTTIAGAGSSAGFLFQMDYSPSWLLSTLNDAAVQGHYVDFLFPVNVQCRELKLVFVEVKLMATVGGTEYQVLAPLSNQGQYGQGAILRAMDCGFAGVLRAPRSLVLPATYTAASIRIVVKEVNGSVPSLRTVVTVEAGHRFQVVS